MTERNCGRWAGAALLCGAATLISLAAYGAEKDKQAADLARYKALLAGAAAMLEAESDPDALAAAGLFRWRTDSEHALRLFERASRAQMSPPGITWLHAALCGATSACDPAPLEARFRAQDPGNVLGWFADIHRAYAAGDNRALEAALARAATLPVVNIHFTSNIGRLATAVDRARALTPGEALTSVTGELSGAPVLVQLTAVARACDEKSLQQPARARSCRALAQSMMAGDTVLAEMLGAAIAKRAWPTNSAEWDAAVEARRVHRYRVERLTPLERVLEGDEQAARDVIALFKVLSREQDVLVARLEAHAIDPVPPAGWRESAPP